MTLNELQQKLNDANAKVEKRINNIGKLCKKLGINENDLLFAYNTTTKSCDDYLPSRIAKEIVSKFTNCDDVDLYDNLVKLYDVQRIAKNWCDKYFIQKNKENAPKIEAIWNFLNQWEQKAINWYLKNAELYFNLKLNYDDNKQKYMDSDTFQNKKNDLLSSVYFMRYYRTEYNAVLHLVDEWRKTYYEDVNSFTKDITTISIHSNSYKVDMERLTKVIAQEKLNKYTDLCNRISKVVGEIQDASNLSIGNQLGELNGIVVGTNGKAKIETISAGGYNIQCFHYRVLVNKVK